MNKSEKTVSVFESCKEQLNSKTFYEEDLVSYYLLLMVDKYFFDQFGKRLFKINVGIRNEAN